MKNRIRIARTNNLSSLSGDILNQEVAEGQPFYDKETNKLYIGQRVQDGNSTRNSKISDFQNDTVKSINSNSAKYAEGNEEETIDSRLDTVETPLNGYDNTKGTIEERLTSLGFKQGNIWDADATNVVGYIHRQGNYALAHIVGPITPSQSTTPGFGGTLALIVENKNYHFVTKLNIINIESSSLPIVDSNHYIVKDNSNKIRCSLHGGLTTSAVSMFDTQSGDVSENIVDELNFGLELFPIVILDVKLSSNVLTISPNLNLNIINFYNNTPLTNLEIRYTTDGSDVNTNNSTLYSGPIELSSSITTIKAAVFENYHVSGMLQPTKRIVSPNFSNIIEQMQHTLTADANGGNISASSGWSGTGNSSTKPIIYNQVYGTLPSVSRSGYTFDGWYNGDIKISSSMTYPYDKDTQIVAKWISS